MGITNEKKGLHDILCDTRVVYEKKIPTYINGDINKRYRRRFTEVVRHIHRKNKDCRRTALVIG